MNQVTKKPMEDFKGEVSLTLGPHLIQILRSSLYIFSNVLGNRGTFYCFECWPCRCFTTKPIYTPLINLIY